jgi:hypothetical protein
MLAKKRPPNITRRQWNNVVGWTTTAHGNTLAATRWIPREQMDNFESELHLRLQGPVDITTIDWIWDEFERLAPNYGPEYSRKYRPTSPEQLREFEEGPFTWSLLIEVD